MMAPVTATTTTTTTIPSSSSSSTVVSQDSLQQQQQQQSEKQQLNYLIMQQQQQQQQIHDDDPDQFIDNDSELSTLEGAALQSRLCVDKMSNEEMKAFNDVVENTSLIPLFLHIRNSILKFWLCNPKQQLLLENVYQRLEQPFNNDLIFISRIFYFLERYGYINFGVFQIQKPMIMIKPKKIAIIGAGIAGLIAARQLKYFGFDVVVFEARNRIGGRIWTYDQKADVGAFVITGLLGNPIRVLAKQINLEMRPINQKCPLYLKNCIVDKSKDEVLENVFNTILESTSDMVKEKNLTINNYNYNDKPLSLGDGLSIIIELHERQVRQEYLKHLNDIYYYYEILSKNLDTLKELEQTIYQLYDKHRESIQSKISRNAKQEYAFRVNRYDLNRAIELYKITEQKCQHIEKRLIELETKLKQQPNEYLSTIDSRILDWHFANLEFATGTSLNNLSLQHWDMDDDYAFAGPQMYAKNGQNQIVLSLANNMADFDIQLNQMVQSITLTMNCVEIQTLNINDQQKSNNNNNNNNNNKSTIHLVDAVLSTLPLGVLKNSINNNNNNVNNEQINNSIQFKPPLPEYKCQAINRLGFGNLNKVVLVFEKIFWDLNTHLFGNVSTTVKNRGELFLFTSVQKQQPVLVAFIAGDAANDLEQIDDEQIKKKCLQILQEMFGQPLPVLKNYFITRWRTDPWSQGSYSYVARGATGDDFDYLAEPVMLQSTTTANETLIPRLFFAGEHTIRNYPSTVHGALLSGLRESAKIANQFLGIPYLKK